ncbi:MAG: NAD(+) synthase [Endomicrobium sp.]|jgi:NAD+ synthase (glutamine-hydrolysing)|nr:NAD(+) synthase [Endomicrobium sp.]
MKIALVQMKVRLGQMRENFENIRRLSQEAKNGGAHLAAFPELCLSGYLMADRWTDEDFCAGLMEYNNKMSELSQLLNIIIVYGNVYAFSSDEKNNDGRKKKLNAAYLASPDGKMHVRGKTLLPNYRIFDDKRYFSSPDISEISPVELNDGVKIGLEVCEDLWCKDYGVNPTQILTERGADFIINVSASPFSVNKSIARDNRIKELKETLGDKFVPFYYVNCVGTQNNGKSIVTFDGDSRVYGQNGISVDAGLKPYQENIIYSCAEKLAQNAAEEKNASYCARTPVEQKYDAIIEAYRDIDDMLGKPNYVFGISGGVDSALNTALCAFAVGHNRVCGYNLSTKNNKKITIDAADNLAENLKIKYSKIDISPLIEPYLTASKEMTLENVQSRVRTTFLMSAASEIDGVLMNNGNKLEMALGYCTIYGDLAGAWCPLADLTKIEIWEMCKLVNKKYGEIIPLQLIPSDPLNFRTDEIIPSAELALGQTDPYKWGWHDILIEKLMDYKKETPESILLKYKKGTLFEEWGASNNMIKKYDLDNADIFIKDLEWFVKKMQLNVFKRIQAPPVLVLSKSAFGADYRESQYRYEFSQKYEELKKEILNNKGDARYDN